ncbi:MAG: hypothetical protein IKX76_00665 [Eubacterium sp.]|nr:hypothetical protein [Eubacterium sp.]
MQNSMFRLEMLKEGRKIRLPILMIFYNSILAFVTILFLFFNSESVQVGYYSNHTGFLVQFLIISSLQILAVFILMPFAVASMEDSDRAVAEQFMMIPGVVRYQIIAKISVLVLTNLLIFLSSLPIVTLSCMYSGISLMKIGRLIGVILLFSFWGGSIALFFFSISRRPLFAFAGTIFTYFMMTVGTLLFLEIIRSAALSASAGGRLPSWVTTLCLLVNLFNPVVVYVGYFENLSGNVPVITSYFGNFGIDVTSRTFSYLYFKFAILACILVGIIFLSLAVHFYFREKSS